MNQVPEFDFKLTAVEVDAVMYALQSAPGGQYSAGFLFGLVNKLNAQGQPQLQALVTQKETPPEDPPADEPEKAGGTD